jgi:hypothetical protein
MKRGLAPSHRSAWGDTSIGYPIWVANVQCTSANATSDTSGSKIGQRESLSAHCSVLWRYSATTPLPAGLRGLADHILDFARELLAAQLVEVFMHLPTVRGRANAREPLTDQLNLNNAACWVPSLRVSVSWRQEAAQVLAVFQT